MSVAVGWSRNNDSTCSVGPLTAPGGMTLHEVKFPPGHATIAVPGTPESRTKASVIINIVDDNTGVLAR